MISRMEAIVSSCFAPFGGQKAAGEDLLRLTSRPHAGDYFSHSSYPQLVEPESLLKQAFDGRTSCVDYETKAAPLLKAFHQTHRNTDAVP